MRLPLLIMQGADPEQVARDYPGYSMVLNLADGVPAPVRLTTGCVCCTGRSELRDTLNRLYIEWAHDRNRLKGVILSVSPEAVLSDLEEFLSEDAILASRWAVRLI